MRIVLIALAISLLAFTSGAQTCLVQGHPEYCNDEFPMPDVPYFECVMLNEGQWQYCAIQPPAAFEACMQTAVNNYVACWNYVIETACDMETESESDFEEDWTACLLIPPGAERTACMNAALCELESELDDIDEFVETGGGNCVGSYYLDASYCCEPCPEHAPPDPIVRLDVSPQGISIRRVVWKDPIVGISEQAYYGPQAPFRSYLKTRGR